MLIKNKTIFGGYTMLKRIIENRKFEKENKELIAWLNGDTVEEKRRIPIELISLIVMGIITAALVVWLIVTPVANNDKKLITKSNLVSEHYSSVPSFYGYEFGNNLISEIKKGALDLYDIYICNEGDSNIDVYLEEGDDAVSGTAEKLIVTKVEKKKYSVEYMKTHFSEDYIKELRESNKDYYWEYTIDVQ